MTKSSPIPAFALAALAVLAAAFFPPRGTAQDAIPEADSIQKKITELLAERQPEPWIKVEELPERAELEEQLDDLVEKQDVDAYLPLALSYLSQIPAGEKFSFHLWRSASFAEWKERTAKAIGPEPLHPHLMDLADKLPKTDPYYFEGRFLRAVTLSRKGDLKGQRKILLDAIALETFPDNFIPSFKGAIALSLEKSGDIEKAIKTGGSLADRLSSSGKACDSVLRAGLLALKSGNEEDGLKLLRKVAGAGYSARSKAVATTTIRELGTLVEPPENIKKHWASSAKWWPEWKKLEEKLKLPPAPLEAPLVADPTALRREMNKAATAGDVVEYFRGYRKLAEAARWLPSVVLPLTESTSLITRKLRPDMADDFRSFMIALHEDFSSEDLDLQRRHEFYFVVYLLEIDDAERALEIVEQFGSRPQRNDALAQGMLQLWALCRLHSGKDLKDPIRALKDLLDGEDLIFDRASIVKGLAQLYGAAGMAFEEEMLLESELEHPDLKKKKELFETLSRRYQALSLLGGAARRFEETVDKWMGTHMPPWYEYASPSSLDSIDEAKLNQLLRDPLAEYSTAEAIKLRLLVATSSKQPIDIRYKEFTSALETLLASTGTHDEYLSLLNSVVNEEGFPSSIRIHFLWRGILEALNGYNAELGMPLIRHPLVKRLSPEKKQALEVFTPFLKTDPESIESVWALYEQTMALPPSRGKVSALLDIFNRILKLGQIEKAEEIYTATGTMPMPPEVPSRDGFRAGMKRLLDMAKKTSSLNDEASKLLLEKFPPESISRPDVMEELRGVIRLRNLPDSDVLGIQTYRAKIGLTGLATSEFWHDLLRSFGGGSEQVDVALAVIDIMLKHAPSDMERSFTVLRSSELVDADDPESLRRLREVLKPYGGPDSGPLTRDALKMLELSLDQRAGKQVDVDAVFDSIKHPVIKRIEPRVRLRSHRIAGDLEALRDAVKEVPRTELLKRTMLPDTITSAKAAGLDAELKAALDQAKEEVSRAFVDSWYSPESGACLTAIELADSLGNPEGTIPPGWIDDCLDAIKNVRANLTVKVEHARLIDDWETAAESSAEAIEKYPTYYYFYFIRGEALYKLGKMGEAAEALKVYTRYAKDEDNYPKALEILKNIGDS